MLRSLVSIVVTAVWTPIMFCACLLAMALTRRASASIFWVRHGWARALLLASGASIEVLGREHARAARPTIYVCNHQSTLDIPLLFWCLPGDLRFVVKRELRRVPVIGWYLVLAGFVFVDRSNRAAAIASLRAASGILRGGASIVAFPEGTRSEGGVILPFKQGVFALALESGAAICPVAIEGTRHVMPKNSWRIRSGPVRVRIGPPIEVAAYAGDGERLISDVRSALIDLHLGIGGQGGNRADAVAQPGREGVGVARPKHSA